MGRLALIWDGVWLTWTTFDSSETVGRREISRQDMIPEVLRALRNQVGAGAQVCHAEWARPASAIPLAMLPDHPTKESWEPLHAMHHGRLTDGAVLTGHTLTSLSNDVLLAVSGDQAWQEAVEGVFPQHRHLPLVHVLVHDAVQWNRRSSEDAWTFRVDVRGHGAVMVAVAGEEVQWVHHLSRLGSAEDALYAMVNAAHRAGVDVNACRALWSGESDWTLGWDRFMEVHPALDMVQKTPADSWWPLLNSMGECA